MAGKDGKHGWTFPMKGKRYVPSFMRSTLVEEPDQEKSKDDYPIRKRQVMSEAVGRFVKEFEAENKGVKISNPGPHLLNTTMADKFEEMLKTLTADKNSVLDAVKFVLENSDSAKEIAGILGKSLTAKGIPLQTMISQLTLLSNILYSKDPSYVAEFHKVLPDIMTNFHDLHSNINANLVADVLKERILKVLCDWNNWSLYSNEYLNQLLNIFQGLNHSIVIGNATTDKKYNCKHADGGHNLLHNLDGDLVTG